MRFRITDELGSQEVEAPALRRGLGGLDVARLLRHLRMPAAAGGPCPACGWTRADLERTGLAGCGLCYSVFEIAAPGEPPGGPGSSQPS
jgi:hypothetical protein